MTALFLLSLPVFADAGSTNVIPPVALAFEPDLFAAPAGAQLPAWIRATGHAQGEVGGNPSSWHGASSLPEGAGKVWIELNREVLNEDLSLTLLYERNETADMAIQLCDSEGRVVALDLFKNVLAVAEQARTDTFIVPVRKFPSATRIVLRRISGDVKLYGAILAPVVTEQFSDLDAMLDLLKRIGDRLSPESDLVRRIMALADARVVAAHSDTASRPAGPTVLTPAEKPDLPPPTPINYAGFDWTPMRTDFELKNDALFTVPHPRAGKFDYGHSGHGRYPAVVTEINSAKLRDYSLEADICASGVNPALNPHGLEPSYHGFYVLLRVVDFKESWNEKGESHLAFHARNDNEHGRSNSLWQVLAARNCYSKSKSGWFNVSGEGNFEIAKGQGLKLDRERGNHVRVDVQGDRVQVWFDGQPVCDVTDARLHDEIDGVKLDHGGLGFVWGFDSMGWVKNIKVRPLGRQIAITTRP